MKTGKLSHYHIIIIIFWLLTGKRYKVTKYFYLVNECQMIPVFAFKIAEISKR